MTITGRSARGADQLSPQEAAEVQRSDTDRWPDGVFHRGARDRGMTTEVKDELSRVVVNSVSARRAEVTSLLRFAGGLHIVGGRVVVEAELDLASIARRLRKNIVELYGYKAAVHVRSASGIRTTTGMCCGSPTTVRRWHVRPDCWTCVAVRCVDCRPTWSAAVSTTPKACGGAPFWRTGGSASEERRRWTSAARPRRPHWRWCGAARRLGVSAKVRGGDRVVVRDGEAIGVLLTRMGAQDTRLVWEQRRLRREARASANRLTNSSTPTRAGPRSRRRRPPPG